MNKIQELHLAGAKILSIPRYDDDRGFFCEVFRDKDLSAATGIDSWKQANWSRSKKNVLRGLHFQKSPGAQAKLVSVIRGAVLDVIVDLRNDSKTYLQHAAVNLSDDRPSLLFVPASFAHGFLVLSDEADVQYYCSDYYNPELESGIRWDDPQLGIKWPTTTPIISEKDRNLPFLSQRQKYII